MIRIHDFNTNWWGSPVGLVHDADFFQLPWKTQEDLLKPYAWVEFFAPLSEAPALGNIHAAGFYQTDTQLQFVLNLTKVPVSQSCGGLKVKFADQDNFEVDASKLAEFEHERFLHLDGCDRVRLNARYTQWANNLVRENRESCMQLFFQNRLQGWFLSHPDERGRLNLTLAMLVKNAEISGMLLYQKACEAYSERGFRLGSASFSIKNTPVHNMYAALGARFLPPAGNWLWQAKEHRANG